jgi:hypothetical protein
MLITEQYRAEQAALHARGNYGTASLQYGGTVADLLNKTGAQSLLDYGCGSKRSLLQALKLPDTIVYEGYDPAIPDFASDPIPAELVCCIDVLEHIEPTLLDNVLDHLGELCDPHGFFTVHTGPAQKVLSDGRNAHLTQQGVEWWLPKFKQRFDVLVLQSIPSGFALVVKSKRSKVSLSAPQSLVLPGMPQPKPSAVTQPAAQTDISSPLDRRFVVTPAPTARGRAVLQHIAGRVATAEAATNPFPYAVIDDIFPADYYAEILEMFPRPEQLRPIADTGRVSKGAYKERSVVLFTEAEFQALTPVQRTFWLEFAGWMYSDLFNNLFILKFQQALEPRIANIIEQERALQVRGDALLVNDQTNYKIGPHTDAAHRLITFLFYMPRDASMRALGTSVYRAKDPDFISWDGTHYPFEGFDFVETVEFMPNRLLVFPKTERSFHGVQQINEQGVNRPLLINNVRVLNRTTH